MRKLFLIIIVLLAVSVITACSSAAAIPTSAVTTEEFQEAFDNNAKQIIINFLERNQFSEIGKADFLGGTVVFWVRGQAYDTQEYIDVLSQSYSLGIDAGINFPSEAENPLQGKVIHVGISTEPNTCIVQGSQAAVNSIPGAVYTPQNLDPSLCTTNAFSVGPESSPSSIMPGYFSRDQLVVAVPFVPRDECGGLIRFTPLGTRKKYCLSPEQATKTGVAHEVTHMILRAIFGSRREGPLSQPSSPRGLDEEEVFASSIEAEFIEKFLGVFPSP